MSRAPGALPGLGTPVVEGGTFLWTGFLLFMYISHQVQSILSGLSGNGSEDFGGLWSQLHPMLHAHSLPLILVLTLYYVVVLSHGKVLSCFHLAPLFQSNLVLFHGTSVPTVYGRLCSHPVTSVRDTQISSSSQTGLSWSEHDANYTKGMGSIPI